MEESPFHQGEVTVQQRVGEEVLATKNSRIIKDYITSNAIDFVNQQQLMIVSSLDDQQNVWTSILIGKPGFVTVVDEKTIRINLTELISDRQDPFWGNVKANPSIGSLFIDLFTRRRLKVNGRISWSGEDLMILVDKAYPNCPRFIQKREIEVAEKEVEIAPPKKGLSLSEELKYWIQNSDTLFVGSANDRKDMDANHRGGKPGFIQIIDDHTLKIPDYPGNSMFNTFGNFLLNPKAGLLVVDFEIGKTLQLTGTSEIVWTEENSENETGGSRRLWKFHINQWLETDLPKGIQWNFIEYSPFNP